MKKVFVFTGGGSGGHVMPALTLMRQILRKENPPEISYIGSYKGIESELVPPLNVPYIPIATGKLRRYFSFQNLFDIFRIFFGLIQALFILRRLKRGRDLFVFSTGGFVAVPVVIAGRILGGHVVIHEQTTRAGLANRISAYFAHQVFLSFEASNSFFSPSKTKLVGYPVRPEFFHKPPRDLSVENTVVLPSARPLLLVTGGGNGSRIINQWIRTHLEVLLEEYRVIHQVGAQFLQEYQPLRSKNYIPVGFLGSEMVPLMQVARFIVSRSGAGTVAELLSLNKPSVFVPLKIAQKNEQYHNAKVAVDKLGSIIVSEDTLPGANLLAILKMIPSSSLYSESQTWVKTDSAGVDRLQRQCEMMGLIS